MLVKLTPVDRVVVETSKLPLGSPMTFPVVNFNNKMYAKCNEKQENFQQWKTV
jgi:hypothetical protein